MNTIQRNKISLLIMVCFYYIYDAEYGQVKKSEQSEHCVPVGPVSDWLPESLSMGMSPSGEELWTTGETTSDIL